MKPTKLPKILLLLLALLIVLKPTLRIALHGTPAIHRNSSLHELQNFARSRSKYDARAGRVVLKAQAGRHDLRMSDLNPGYLRAQPALYGVLTQRQLLNIHFRILPERKIFLQQGRLTV